ncbi:hypothetical protein ACW9IO_17890 [Pseudomonas azotoformans]
MDKSTKRILAGFYVFLTSLPGPLLLLTYKTITNYNPNYSLSLFSQRSNIAVILATYAFTMLGFLAAVIAILLGFSQTRTFREYKRNQYLDIFFTIYFYCIITLVFTFLSSILSLSSSSAEVFMRAALALAANSMVLVAIISAAIINICRRSL